MAGMPNEIKGYGLGYEVAKSLVPFIPEDMLPANLKRYRQSKMPEYKGWQQKKNKFFDLDEQGDVKMEDDVKVDLDTAGVLGRPKVRVRVARNEDKRTYTWDITKSSLGKGRLPTGKVFVIK
jgi:hypothetical protein